jgi:hypothetical protein
VIGHSLYLKSSDFGRIGLVIHRVILYRSVMDFRGLILSNRNRPVVSIINRVS